MENLEIEIVLYNPITDKDETTFLIIQEDGKCHVEDPETGILFTGEIELGYGPNPFISWDEPDVDVSFADCVESSIMGENLEEIKRLVLRREVWLYKAQIRKMEPGSLWVDMTRLYKRGNAEKIRAVYLAVDGWPRPYLIRTITQKGVVVFSRSNPAGKKDSSD